MLHTGYLFGVYSVPNIALNPTRAGKLFRVLGFPYGRGRVSFHVGLQVNYSEQLSGRMVFSTAISLKARLAFGVAATLPLLAPYELLIKPVWTDTPSPAWLFAVIISLGAIAVSIFLLLVAIFGINRRVEFDAKAKTIRVTESHLMQRQRECNYPFSEITQLEIVCHDWSDGPSTYKIRLTPSAGKPFAFGDFASRIDAESALSSLCAMTAR